MSEHTPGPWAVRRGNDLEITSNAGNVEAVINSRKGSPTAEANAHLIAAAPDLLSACETALAYCYDNLAQEMWMKELADAINKAKGL